jgi:thiol:disulfide interchange protein DsbC
MHVSKKTVLSTLLIIIVLTGLMASAALGAATVAKPEESLKKVYPQLVYESIEPTDIPGLYEVTAGQNVIYYYPEKDYLFIGDIYVPPGKSLTAEKRSALTAKLLKTIPLEKAVKVGNGKKVVIEFTDPDCPYCKKVSEFFKNRTDVTRYVFFSPFAHPQAAGKIHYILAAADKEKAYKEMMLSANPPQPKGDYSEAVKSLAQEHMALAQKLKVQGTPTMFVGEKQVVGADIPQLEQLLKN